jgi:hypothetical protein
MGKRVSGTDKKDRDYYLINLPYIDYFIVRSILELEMEEGPIINIGRIKERYQRKEGCVPSASLWSDATLRLSRRGLIHTTRQECLKVQISSAPVRSQLKVVFSEMKKLDDVIESSTRVMHTFEETQR